MPTFDFAPLYRSTVGFDRLMRVFDDAAQLDGAPTYPPYNIEKLGDDAYRITMAVAGFKAEEINVVGQPNSLVITAKKKEEPKTEYLHRGIAARAFERRFDLADYIRVKDAVLADGLLHIDLVREIPEALKPQTIKVATKSEPQQLEGKAA
jgi:molecular chaperone IbpA